MDRDGEAPTAKAGAREALRAVSWSSAEKWYTRITGLVTFVVLGRLLEPTAFGLVAAAMAVTTLVETATNMGFATYLVQVRELTARVINTAFWTAVAISAAAAAVLAAAAPIVADLVGIDELTPMFRLLALSLLFGGLASTPTALLTRQLKFKLLAQRRFVAVTLGAVSGVVTALLGLGAYALVVQLLVVQGVTAVITLAVTRWELAFEWSGRLAKDVATYGAKSVSVDLIQQARDQGEVLIIGAVLGAAALGYWVVAMRILLVLTDLISASLSSAALPFFSQRRDDPDALGRAYGGLQTACALVAVPVFAVAAVASPLGVPLLFGDQWERSGELAALLTLGAIAGAVSFFDRPLLIAVGRIGTEVKLVAIIVALHLSMVALGSWWGLVGVAVAAALRPWLTWPLRIFTVWRFGTVGIGYQLNAVRIALAGLVMSAAASGVLVAVGRTDSIAATALAIAAVTLAYLGFLAAAQRGQIQGLRDTLRSAR